MKQMKENISPKRKEAAVDLSSLGVVEIRVETFRSSGKGGQKVNKTETAVRVRGRIINAKLLARLRELFPGSVTDEGEFYVECQEERSQEQNIRKAHRRFEERIHEALKEPVERVATVPTEGAKERREVEKRRQGLKKENRKKVEW
ncbi:MAG: aminoacyl-tRNA hydrolase [Patescibacteria group bacterium]|nr:aminoacyl-tRNA hydrolase [Patescibacteria group bacterium]MDE2438582.1 aminoacyl-tRNA hydrolase [Patescibacteria group bacterium]